MWLPGNRKLADRDRRGVGGPRTHAIGRMAMAAMAAIALAGGRAGAEPITTTLEATASGTLNGVSFTNATVIFTQTADTTSVVTYGTGQALQAVTSTFSVQGVGSGSFTDQTGFLAQNNEMTLFDGSVTTPSVTDIMVGNFSTLGLYNLKTSIGPADGSAFLHSGSTFNTTVGGLNFSSFSGTLVFTATVVPEPPSLVSVALAGLIGLGYTWRRRRARLIALA